MTENTGRLAARFLLTMAAVSGDVHAARGFIDAHTGWGDLARARLKSAVGAIAVGHVDADPLRAIGADFLDYLRPLTIVGQLENQLRRVPEKVATIRLVAGGQAAWVGEGEATPVSRLAATRDGRLDPKTIAALSVLTAESARRIVGLETAALTDLASATVEVLDGTFLSGDPGTSTSPAGILHNAMSLPASGTNAAAAARDLADLLDMALRADRCAFVVSALMAARLATLLPAGAINLSPGSRHLLGLPLLTTSASATSSSSSGEAITLIDPARLEITGLLDARLKATTEASLLLDDTPSMDSTTPNAAQLVSLWQTNAVALQARLDVNWRPAPDAVVFIDGAAYGAQ